MVLASAAYVQVTQAQCEGPSLSSINSKAPLGRVTVQCVFALAYAHRAGVYRDPIAYVYVRCTLRVAHAKRVAAMAWR